MTGGEPSYLHGFDSEERDRLVRQAEYWRTSLIPLGLAYHRGERVLEIGCAVGATLGVLARDFPGIELAGVDLEKRQVEFARHHLATLGFTADLRVADGARLPWRDDDFDHVYIMWVLEHLHDALPVVREAARVLRPGGSLAVTETDYTTFRIDPVVEDFDYLARAQHDYFARHGNATIGRQLGPLLTRAGFTDVRNAPVGFHFFGQETTELRDHALYEAGFLAPAIDKLAHDLGRDEARLRGGVEALERLARDEHGAITQIVYRAHGRKPD